MILYEYQRHLDLKFHLVLAGIESREVWRRHGMYAVMNKEQEGRQMIDAGIPQLIVSPGSNGFLRCGPEMLQTIGQEAADNASSASKERDPKVECA